LRSEVFAVLRSQVMLTPTTVLTAITRGVSPAIAKCELSFVERQPIDLCKATAQHQAYERLLGELGARVVSLPAEAHLPDSMFVEDPAIVLDELAVILTPGAESRRPEIASLANALSRFRKLEYVKLPGTLEGGDLLRVGRKLFAGLSRRSNGEGIRQLAALLSPYDYEVIAVPVSGCLHLKSAVTCLGGNTLGGNALLGNRDWFDAAPFAQSGSVFDWIDVPRQEPHGANTLALGGLILPASFPRTRALVESRGFQTIALDISELQKAEAGLTCSSLLFESHLRA
jgi:dimethylargininase